MKTKLENLKAELSPLTIYGVILIIFILGVYGILQLFGLVQMKKVAIIEAKKELHELNNLQSEDVWSRRLTQSEAIKAKAKMTLWQGATEGVVAATLQQSLQSVAQRASIKILSVKINPVPEIIENQKILTFEIIGDASTEINPAYILQLLASEPRTILIGELSFRLDPKGIRPSRFTISGSIPMVIVDSENAEIIR